jgi:SAM-dependent methyltransferase
MKFIKEAFEPITFEQAKNTVLVPDSNNPDKFIAETKFLIDAIEKENIIHENTHVLDFGCGMGRVSKELINRFSCNVTGIDISERMKVFASLYVSNPKKFKTSSSINESVFDVALSIFALQHTQSPDQEVKKIANSLVDNGIFILLNEPSRMVPVDVDIDGYVVWNDDKFDVFSEVEKYFTKLKSIVYEPNKGLTINFYKKHV